MKRRGSRTDSFGWKNCWDYGEKLIPYRDRMMFGRNGLRIIEIKLQDFSKESRTYFNEVKTMRKKSEFDIAELYPPPRVTIEAVKLGLGSGVALVIATNDEDCKTLGFVVVGKGEKF